MVEAVLTHSVNRESNTPEPGGVGATCRKNWTQVLFSPNTDSLDGSSLLSFPHLSYLAFSQRVSLYSKPMWWAHVPKGPSTQFHILCSTYCLAWDEQTRNSGRKGSYSAWKGEGPGLGIFQDLLGLCWHPVQLCYQLQLGIRGYSSGILGCRRGGVNLAVKCTCKMCIWFVLGCTGVVVVFMVYIRILILKCAFHSSRMSVCVTAQCLMLM